MSITILLHKFISWKQYKVFQTAGELISENKQKLHFFLFKFNVIMCIVQNTNEKNDCQCHYNL